LIRTLMGFHVVPFIEGLPIVVLNTSMLVIFIMYLFFNRYELTVNC